MYRTYPYPGFVSFLIFLFTALAPACHAQASDNVRFVTIGKQVWMTKNLDVNTFANGDKVPEAKTSKEWKTASDNKQPAWCYYDNDTTNRKYGKLYNWYAVHDPRGLAPKGWRIPSDQEWTTLNNGLGMDNAGDILKSEVGWNSFNGSSGNGKNAVGFAGLPSGGRNSKGQFAFKGYYAYWWSFVEDETNDAWYYHVCCEDGKVYRYSSFSKGVGYSVRCIRN